MVRMFNHSSERKLEHHLIGFYSSKMIISSKFLFYLKAAWLYLTNQRCDLASD